MEKGQLKTVNDAFFEWVNKQKVSDESIDNEVYQSLSTLRVCDLTYSIFVTLGFVVSIRPKGSLRCFTTIETAFFRGGATPLAVWVD